MKIPAGWGERQFREAMKRANEAYYNYKPNIEKFSPEVKEQLKKLVKGNK